MALTIAGGVSEVHSRYPLTPTARRGSSAVQVLRHVRPGASLPALQPGLSNSKGLHCSSGARPEGQLQRRQAAATRRARPGAVHVHAAAGAVAQNAAQASALAAPGAPLLLLLAALILVVGLERRIRARNAGKPRVIIVGASFAGLQAAFDLGSSAEVVVIDGKSFFEFTPGVLRALVRGSLRSRQLPLQEVLKHATSLRVPGAAFHISDGELRVTAPGLSEELRKQASSLFRPDAASDSASFPFDFCIISSGSSYPAPFKASTDESDIDSRLRGFERAREELRAARSVSISGAGVVGVELAAEIVAFHGDAKAIRLQDPGGLLATLSPKAAEYAARFLSKRGVTISLGKGAGASAAEAAPPPSPEVRYKCFGVRAQGDAFSGEAVSAARTPQGYLQRDARLRLRGTDNVFVLGDVAEKSPEERLASYAHWEAEYVVAQIHAMWRRGAVAAGEPFAPYTPPVKLVNVSLGPWDGIFTYDDRILATGVVAALIKAVTEFWFVRLLPIPYTVLRLLPRLGPAKLGGITALPAGVAVASNN